MLQSIVECYTFECRSENSSLLSVEDRLDCWGWDLVHEDLLYRDEYFREAWRVSGPDFDAVLCTNLNKYSFYRQNYK